MKFILIFLSLLLLLPLYILNHTQKQIMHPSKRTLQPYHKEWLEHPQQHSMNIEKHQDTNHTPYLIVTLNPHAKTSKRVETIEKQLKQREIDVKSIRNNAKILVLLHGKNGRKEDLLPVAERYIALGFTCIIPDLPSHGESQIETLYYATTKYEQLYIDKVLDDASTHITLNNNLYIWGMSLGGAFAIQTVYHSKHTFKGMVLVATYDELEGVMKEESSSIFGKALGSIVYSLINKSLNSFYEFNPKDSNSINTASKLTLPLFMTHGKKDELIRWERGKNLFQSFSSSEKKLTLDEDGDHHNILTTKAEFFADSGVFMLRNQ